MRKRINQVIIILVILMGMSFIPGINLTKTQAANPGPFFYISILAPNTNPARNQWTTLMTEQLPKIGIGVDVFDHTSWSQIYPRTWDYPGPFPIPTYSEGGYDIFFTPWGGALDYDPTGRFDTPGIIPNGDNVYQYSNIEMDWAVWNYTSSFITADRIEYAKDIQALLYEELPQLTIIYPASLYPMDEDFSGWDGLLWATCQQPMENWKITGNTEFHYAIPASFQDFHIYHYESIYDKMWLRQIYNGLLERQPGTRQWGNRLATSFTSVDGLTWTIDINPNAKWADGTALTAYDVNYSYNLLIDPDFGFPDISYWNNYIDVDSINIINPKQVEITFLQPYVFQESNLALDLIPEHIWSAIDPADHETQASIWAATDPNYLLGAGPYYLADYDGTNQIIHLTRNDYFDDWSGITPHFEDIYFEFYSNKEGALSALAAGNIDMVDANFSPQLDVVAAIPGVTYEVIEDSSSEEIAVNMRHPYLGTGSLCPISGPESAEHIRKAISHMIPREVIVDEILNGLGQEGVTAWSPVSIGFDDTLSYFEYSYTLALNEMAAAGFPVSTISPTPTPTNTTNITPTTIILGITFSTVITTFILVGCSIIIIHYKKRRNL